LNRCCWRWRLLMLRILSCIATACHPGCVSVRYSASGYHSVVLWLVQREHSRLDSVSGQHNDRHTLYGGG
jgi:hypothetical protein